MAVTVLKRKWTYKGETKSAWAVRWHDGGGRKRSRTFERKKDADAYAFRLKTELVQGHTLATRDSMSLTELCEMFIREQEDRFRDGQIGWSYLKHLKGGMDAAVIPLLGGKKLRDIVEADVLAFYRTLRREPRALTYTSAQAYLQILKRMLAFAIKHKAMTKNPVGDVIRETTRAGGAEPIRTFTTDQVRTILSACQMRAKAMHRRTPPYLSAIVSLAAYCGLRRGEIFGLTRKHLRLDERIVQVRHSLTEHGELKGPKTKSGIRDVPIPEHVVPILRLWLDRYFVPNERDLIFRTAFQAGDVEGNLNPAQNFAVMWLALLKRAGLYDADDRFHFHALRHFAASWWIGNGVPLTDVARLMGHRNFDTTLQVYAHSISPLQHLKSMLDNSAILLAPPTTQTQTGRNVAQVIDFPISAVSVCETHSKSEGVVKPITSRRKRP